MDEDTHKHGKIKLTREKDGTTKVNYQFHQEQLVIPNKIGDHVLSDEDRHKLGNNQVVGPVKYGFNELYIRVDPDLNAVTVRTANDISIPNVIGKNQEMQFDGYILNETDKNKLANGGALPTKLFCGKDGYFTANFSLCEDMKGVIFTNVKSVPLHKVKELEAKFNVQKSNTVENVINAGNRSVEENKPPTTLENVTHSSNDMIKGSNRVKNEILDVKTTDIVTTDHIINSNVIEKPEKDLVRDTKEQEGKLNENDTVKGKLPVINSQTDQQVIISKSSNEQNAPAINTDLSKEFLQALEKRDFKKLNDISSRGWKPADDEIKGLDKMSNLSENDKIAVKTIFNLENKQAVPTNSSKTEQKNKQDLKFHKGEEKNNKSDHVTRKVKDVMNAGFNTSKKPHARLFSFTVLFQYFFHARYLNDFIVISNEIPIYNIFYH